MKAWKKGKSIRTFILKGAYKQLRSLDSCKEYAPYRAHH